MAEETQIIVHDVNVTPMTGHITYLVRTKTTKDNAEWYGPLRQYGIDQQMLRDRFHGSLDEFEAWIVKEHHSIAGAHPKLVEDVMARKGKVLG